MTRLVPEKRTRTNKIHLLKRNLKYELKCDDIREAQLKEGAKIGKEIWF